MPSHELKAQTQLRISASRLSAADLISLVTQAAQGVTVPVLSQPQRIKVVGSTASTAEFAITVAPRRVPLATFSATASDRTDGGSVQVGGLDQYRTKQTAILGLIPAGPKSIPAFGLYKKFIEDIEHAVTTKDPEAKITRVP